MGKGKINAPGGRIEKGETPLEAAIRETEEETGVTPSHLKKVGELHFIFRDGYSLHGTVFFATQFTGILKKTREADPFWCPIDKLPYHQMWEDDKYWLPLALKDQFKKGYFLFDDDKMLNMKIETF